MNPEKQNLLVYLNDFEYSLIIHKSFWSVKKKSDLFW